MFVPRKMYSKYIFLLFLTFGASHGADHPVYCKDGTINKDLADIPHGDKYIVYSHEVILDIVV